MKRLVFLAVSVVMTVSCSKSTTTPSGPMAPVVNTNPVSGITTHTAGSGGNVTSDGGATVTERGICFSTAKNPTTSDNKIPEGNGSGSFTSAISGLQENTRYYIRAYATNGAGTSYGDGIEFSTIFDTIQIGSQVWMKHNLNTSTYRNGDPVPDVTDTVAWASLNTGAWGNYKNDPANGAVYGKLYNWYAVNDIRNLAPAGWHVATDADWTTLTSFLGSESAAGGKLKETGTAHWNSPNTDASDSVGFDALPGGLKGYQGDYSMMGIRGYWWTSSQALMTNVWYRIVYNDDAKVLRDSFGPNVGFSVRCVKD